MPSPVEWWLVAYQGKETNKVAWFNDRNQAESFARRCHSEQLQAVAVALGEVNPHLPNLFGAA